MKAKNKTIAFLCPYPYGSAPGQRFRYEQYFQLLKEKGFSIEIYSFLSASTFNILYKKGYWVKKTLGILHGFIRRSVQLFLIIPFEFIFIYREASPIGFPVFEWILVKILRKKIIYDFDDSIWIGGTSSENKIVQKLKYHQKVSMICRWSYKVSAGNKYLCDFALQYNRRSIINPTTIDTENYHNRIKEQKTKSVVIGWTGTHSTLVYLNMIYPVLKKLDEEYDFRFMVIADKEISFNLKNFVFKKWNKETEIEDLLIFNIGLMPLTDDEWAKGKCGFKALQYMSLGIPPVISPVGVNSEIVSEGIDGFLCDNEMEWYQKLEILIKDASLREKMGRRGLEKVTNNYSVLSNSENFLSLFN